MGLLLICPHCQTKLPLACQTCRGCGADLGDLPAQERRYFIGNPFASEEAGSALTKRRELFPEIVEAKVTEPVSETAEAEVFAPDPKTMLPGTPLLDNKDVSLCEALDRILNKGAVLFGEVMISVADIDLVYLGLQVILASMETAQGLKPPLGAGQVGPNLFHKGVH